MTRKAGRMTLALALAAGALASCSQADGSADADAVRTAPPPVRTIAYELSTHCGIDEAHVGSTYFEAETPLSDGSGNPPDGWGNPTQLGTMTLTSETEAVFTDGAGHEVRFRARPGARAFKHICS
ncbi:hypothetical protein ACH4Q7_05785 [Streptomyces roseolus]|uniref:hypothetical protein n=1 Tax=Streptomyces roseolus TaxID=67358 RepID=UPI00378D8D82